MMTKNPRPDIRIGTKKYESIGDALKEAKAGEIVYVIPKEPRKKLCPMCGRKLKKRRLICKK